MILKQTTVYSGYNPFISYGKWCLKALARQSNTNTETPSTQSTTKHDQSTRMSIKNQINNNQLFNKPHEHRNKNKANKTNLQ